MTAAQYESEITHNDRAELTSVRDAQGYTDHDRTDAHEAAVDPWADVPAPTHIEPHFPPAPPF